MAENFSSPLVATSKPRSVPTHIRPSVSSHMACTAAVGIGGESEPPGSRCTPLGLYPPIQRSPVLVARKQCTLKLVNPSLVLQRFSCPPCQRKKARRAVPIQIAPARSAATQ